MHAKKWVMSAAWCLVAVVALAAVVRASDDETKAVAEANADFYTSLNELFTGDTDPMTDVWSHEDDVTYLGPAGDIQLGWEEVRNNWEQQAALKIGGTVEASQIHTVIAGDVAISQCYETASNHNIGGRDVAVTIRATNVFRKENGQWKMISHHTDLIPQLEEEIRTRSIE